MLQSSYLPAIAETNISLQRYIKNRYPPNVASNRNVPTLLSPTYGRSVAQAGHNTFSGSIPERYFRQKNTETGLYNNVSNYWHREADEIDLIAVDEADKRLVIAECKRRSKRIDLDLHREKGRAIVAKRRRWQVG